MGNARFYLDQDESSHWYAIPVERKAEWTAFCELNSDDPASWDTPEWAISLGSHPNAVSFENWQQWS